MHHERGVRRNMAQEYADFADVYDLLMSDVDYDGWVDYLAALLKQHGIAHGDTILDAACGTGELTIRLKRAGYAMTGLDRSERMLEIAQQKARKAGLQIPMILQDMQSIRLHKPVSAITCACDGVNYLLTDEDLSAFFAASNKALSENGMLLFDISSAYKLEHVLGGHTFGEDTKACTYLWQNCFDPETRLLEMRLAFFRPDGAGAYRRFDERHVQRAHTVERLTDALQSAGFAIEGIWDAFTTSPPQPSSERIQFAARKQRAV